MTTDPNLGRRRAARLEALRQRRAERPAPSHDSAERGTATAMPRQHARRRHAATGGRILAGSLSAAAALGLMGAMAQPTGLEQRRIHRDSRRHRRDTRGRRHPATRWCNRRRRVRSPAHRSHGRGTGHHEPRELTVDAHARRSLHRVPLSGDGHRRPHRHRRRHRGPPARRGAADPRSRTALEPVPRHQRDHAPQRESRPTGHRLPGHLRTRHQGHHRLARHRRPVRPHRRSRARRPRLRQRLHRGRAQNSARRSFPSHPRPVPPASR